MSRIYEALRRASKGPRTGIEGSTEGEGSALLGAVETLPSVVSGNSLESASSGTAARLETAGPRRHTRVQPPANVMVPPGVGSSDIFRQIHIPIREESRLAYRTDPYGLASEQFRFVRRNLRQRFPEGGIVMVSSPAPQDGKTFTSVNLCCCLGDGGKSTLLVEADIRQPKVSKVLGCLSTPPGIEDAMRGRVEPSAAVQALENLSFCAAMVATPPSDPSHLIGGEGITQFLAWARENFHWVILDAPPVLPAADVTELMPLADAVLLVVRAQRTPRELSNRAIELVGKRLCGVILNEGTVDTNPYYRYMHQYYGGARGMRGKKG